MSERTNLHFEATEECSLRSPTTHQKGHSGIQSGLRAAYIGTRLVKTAWERAESDGAREIVLSKRLSMQPNYAHVLLLVLFCLVGDSFDVFVAVAVKRDFLC